MKRKVGRMDNHRAESDAAIKAAENGNTSFTEGDLEMALVHYTEAIRLAPRFAEAYYNRGVVHGQKVTSTRRLPTSTRPSGLTRKTPRRTTTAA